MWHQASNVVLDGRLGTLQLADFGVGAKLEYDFSAEHCARRLSRTTYVGSPAFMAPEVINPCGGAAGEEGYEPLLRIMGWRVDVHVVGRPAGRLTPVLMRSRSKRPTTSAPPQHTLLIY